MEIKMQSMALKTPPLQSQGVFYSFKDGSSIIINYVPTFGKNSSIENLTLPLNLCQITMIPWHIWLKLRGQDFSSKLKHFQIHLITTIPWHTRLF
jgi:hypothetical protein